VGSCPMRNRLLSAGLVAAMALGSLALWIVVPIGWLWATRDLESGGRFLLTVPGCVLTMAGCAWWLSRLQEVHTRVSGAEKPVLESLLAASAVIALISLVVWWALLADSPNPSGPLQPL
jgi:hypothetical protein